MRHLFNMHMPITLLPALSLICFLFPTVFRRGFWCQGRFEGSSEPRGESSGGHSLHWRRTQWHCSPGNRRQHRPTLSRCPSSAPTIHAPRRHINYHVLSHAFIHSNFFLCFVR